MKKYKYYLILFLCLILSILVTYLIHSVFLKDKILGQCNCKYTKTYFDVNINNYCISESKDKTELFVSASCSIQECESSTDCFNGIKKEINKLRVK